MKRIRLTTDEFTLRANEKHKNKYDYSLVEYITAKINVNISCPIHGNFLQMPYKHLEGCGCPKCGLEKVSNDNLMSIDEFISKSLIRHNNKYSYSTVNYISCYTKIKIICPTHGEFEQTPHGHLSGRGCSKCAQIGRINAAKENAIGFSLTSWVDKVNKTKNATPRLYVLKCYDDNETFIKVGITMRTIKKRYNGKSRMPYSFDILIDIVSTSENVFKLEKLVTKNFKKHTPKIKFDGVNECYDIKQENEIISYCNNL